ncbi:MAG: DUF2779 domain-containing protein [Actinomycetota bacterium]
MENRGNATYKLKTIPLNHHFFKQYLLLSFKMTLLTKSKYVTGLQCPRCLWVMMHEKERIPEPDVVTQHRFDQGHLAGNLAKSCFPKGIDISEDDFMKNIETTKELLKKRKPLFEAGIMADNLYSRADILRPVKDAWDIIEVKSSTKVKDVNIQDVSFQKYVYEKAGLKINKCFLMHINNQYVRKGKIDPNQLFIIEDITEDVNSASIGIQERIKALFDAISKKECPEISIGPFCRDPYECALHEECWHKMPKNSVFDLYGSMKKGFELFDNGITNIKDIPDDFRLTTNQQIQRECEKTKKPFIDKDKIKEFLNSLEYPLYYLDFETYSTAIPLYDDLKPYQQLPFQFSLHIYEKNGKITHKEFLAKGKGDPRKEFLKALKAGLGDKGDIIVYHQCFEIGRLKELAEALPEYKEWVASVIDRIVDLLMPFRKFYYYNPKQQGSASLKKVLPAITGKDYSHLEISEGMTASLQYLEITHGEGTKEEIEKIRKQLLEYCCLDTEAMVWIIDELKKLCN